jgi:hypothetical protein
MRAVVSRDRVAEIELQTEPKDDREAIRAADALDHLVRLHDAGLYKTELSYDHIDRIAITVAAKDGRARHVIAATGSAPPPMCERRRRNRRCRSSRGITSSVPTNRRRSFAAWRRFPKCAPTRPVIRTAAATRRSSKSPCRRRANSSRWRRPRPTSRRSS